MAFEICSNYGMNETIGPVSYGRQDNEGFQKPFSEKTGQMLDDEVRKLVQIARERTRVLLTEKREQVETVAKRLLEKEVLTRCVRPSFCRGPAFGLRHELTSDCFCLSSFSEAMVDLLGKRPFDIQDDMDDWMDKNQQGKNKDKKIDIPPP